MSRQNDAKAGAQDQGLPFALLCKQQLQVGVQQLSQYKSSETRSSM